MELIKLIIERWNGETPTFFSGVKKLALSLGSSATAILIANETFLLGLDEPVLTLCKYAIAACAAMGMTSQLTMVPPKK
jgi:hypothetical protein